MSLVIGRQVQCNLARLVSAWPRRLALPASTCGIFLAYAALAETSYLFVFPPSKNALFWLPSGLALALLLRARAVCWAPWLFAIVLAQIVVVSRHGLPLHVAASWGLAAGLSPLSGALLLRRFAPGPFTICHVVDVVLFVGLGAAVATIPGALVAAAALAWLGMPSFLMTAVSWWSSDALGILLLGPLILTWVARQPRPSGGTLEALALFVALTSVGWQLFGSEAPSAIVVSFPYLLIPFTAWAALRFGTRGATLATTVLDFLAVWHTMQGRGPFALMSVSPAPRVLNVQIYVSVVSIFALLLATVMAQQQEARAAAEQAEHRAEFLSMASVILSGSLNYAQTLADLACLCVRRLSDWCVIDVVEGSAIRRVGGAHADPSKEGLIRELTERYTPDWHSPQPAARVLRSGEPLLLSEVTSEVHRVYTVDEENARLLTALGAESAIAVPLVVRGTTIGAITLCLATPGQRYGPLDLALALELSRRAAIAVDNARLYRDAQEAIRIREEFVAIASHELNTPLTSLLLSVQALTSGRVASPDRVARSLTLIERQTRRLARLVEELLSVSRITAGRLELHLQEVDLAAVVRSAVEHLSEDLSRVGCQLSVRAEATVIGLWDSVRLEQVVINLLANAIKFGGGAPIEVTVGEKDGMAWLMVTDHGIGIPKCRLAGIFKRFERAVSVRAYSGLGLGLYIVRAIVEALGGSVRAESELGEGATFTVELPCAGPSTKEAAPKGDG